MKALMYGNRKADTTFYDISTPEKEAAAYLRLFAELRDDWQVYSELQEDDEETVCEPCGEGIHKYCKGEDASCTCDKTDKCKLNNSRTLHELKVRDVHRSLFNQAEAGDWNAAKKLMKARKGYEYEEVSEVNVKDPTEKKGK
jgi:hypothetical protein